MKRELILGGAGAIGSRTIGAALACSAAHEIVVADLSLDAAAKAAAHHPGRAVPLQLDVFDETDGAWLRMFEVNVLSGVEPPTPIPVPAG